MRGGGKEIELFGIVGSSLGHASLPFNGEGNPGDDRFVRRRWHVTPDLRAQDEQRSPVESVAHGSEVIAVDRHGFAGG